MGGELDQNELQNILQRISNQLEKIAGSLATIAEIAQANRKKDQTPFPRSHKREGA